MGCCLLGITGKDCKQNIVLKNIKMEVIKIQKWKMVGCSYVEELNDICMKEALK